MVMPLSRGDKRVIHMCYRQAATRLWITWCLGSSERPERELIGVGVTFVESLVTAVAEGAVVGSVEAVCVAAGIGEGFGVGVVVGPFRGPVRAARRGAAVGVGAASASA